MSTGSLSSEPWVSGSCNIRLGRCSLENPVAGRHSRTLSQACGRLPAGRVCRGSRLGSTRSLPSVCPLPVSRCPGAGRWSQNFCPCRPSSTEGAQLSSQLWWPSQAVPDSAGPCDVLQYPLEASASPSVTPATSGH